MSWSIAEIVNSVEIPIDCAKELYDGQSYKGDIWDDLDGVTCDGKLYFNPDHMEWMDYVNTNTEWMVPILNKYNVKGDICFGSLEGDNEGTFWGYRFDGNGNMSPLTGKLEWIMDE
jgi:hypothetical protein